MKRVTLTDLRDDRKIVAIKNLRAVTGLGLKDSKYIVDRMSDPMMRTEEDISVLPDADISVLDESFRYTVEPENAVDRDLVLNFMFAAFGHMSPEQAVKLCDTGAYLNLRKVV